MRRRLRFPRGLHVRRRLLCFAIALVVVGAVRLALPGFLRGYVEGVLSGIEGYSASVGGVDVQLWRGAYEVENLELSRRTRLVDVPFLAVRELDLSVRWGELLDGEVVGELGLYQPVLTFVKHESEAYSQTEIDRTWQERVERLFPLRFDRVVVQEGKIAFEGLQTRPPVDLELADVAMEIVNLTNVRTEAGDELPSWAWLRAEAQGHAQLVGAMRFDALADPPRIEADVSLRDLELTRINDFLRAYAGIDAEAGTLDLLAEFATSGGRIAGYVKTFFEGMEIVSLEDLEGPDDVLSFFWEALVSVAAEVLENQPTDRLATRIPLEGSLEGPEPDLWSAIAGVVRNGFLKAVVPDVEGSVEIEDVEGEGGAGAEASSP